MRRTPQPSLRVAAGKWSHIRAALPCAVLGVITTVLTAWFFAYRTPLDNTPDQRPLISDRRTLRWLWPVPDEWPEPNLATVLECRGWSQTSVMRTVPTTLAPGFEVQQGTHVTSRERSGWPFPALDVREMSPQPTSEQTLWAVCRLRLDEGIVVRSGYSSYSSLPLRPYWPGFLAGVASWSICWGSVLGLGRRTVRLRRRARGLCISCRYPVRDLDTCPECGAAVRRRST